MVRRGSRMNLIGVGPMIIHSDKKLTLPRTNQPARERFTLEDQNQQDDDQDDCSE
jgi:hypothetical protein